MNKAFIFAFKTRILKQFWAYKYERTLGDKEMTPDCDSCFQKPRNQKVIPPKLTYFGA